MDKLTKRLDILGGKSDNNISSYAKPSIYKSNDLSEYHFNSWGDDFISTRDKSPTKIIIQIQPIIKVASKE